MKIMINFLAANSGGALSYLRNLLPLLVQRFDESDDNDLCVLLSSEQKNNLGDTIRGVEVVEIENPRAGIHRVFWEMTTLNQLIAKHDIDVFFTPYQLAPKVKRVKTVSMIRNMEPFYFKNYKYSWKTYLRNVILSYACPRTLIGSDRVIAVSQYARKYCTEVIGIQEEKTTLIYHGRDKSFSSMENPSDREKLGSLKIEGDYIFTCGSLLPYRRCEKIVEAFGEWVGDKDCMLVIAGTSNDYKYIDAIDSTIEGSPAKSKINYLGQVTPDQMRVLYRRCKLFVTATEIEACPNIGIEALSSGCHILASDNDPLPEIFNDAADYFSRQDKQELLEKLDLLYCKANGTNKLAEIRANDFCWEKCSAETFTALTEW